MVKRYFVIFVSVFTLTALACGQLVFAGAEDDLENTYEDTSSFDGGPGSTINTSPSGYDNERGYDPYEVPDIGECGPVDQSE